MSALLFESAVIVWLVDGCTGRATGTGSDLAHWIGMKAPSIGESVFFQSLTSLVDCRRPGSLWYVTVPPGGGGGGGGRGSFVQCSSCTQIFN